MCVHVCVFAHACHMCESVCACMLYIYRYIKYICKPQQLPSIFVSFWLHKWFNNSTAVDSLLTSLIYIYMYFHIDSFYLKFTHQFFVHVYIWMLFMEIVTCSKEWGKLREQVCKYICVFVTGVWGLPRSEVQGVCRGHSRYQVNMHPSPFSPLIVYLSQSTSVKQAGCMSVHILCWVCLHFRSRSEATGIVLMVIFYCL